MIVVNWVIKPFFFPKAHNQAGIGRSKSSTDIYSLRLQIGGGGSLHLITFMVGNITPLVINLLKPVYRLLFIKNKNGFKHFNSRKQWNRR